MFSLDLITGYKHASIFIRSTPEMHSNYADAQLLSGQLILWTPQRCLRVISESGLRDIMPIWPPGYSIVFEEDALMVLDETRIRVGRKGEQIVFSGGEIPTEWENEAYQQLRRALPGDCHGPYWIVREGK